MRLLARLRKISIEKEIAGSVTARDKCIERFLEEFREQANPALLDACDDNTLYVVYRSWLSWCMQGATVEQRAELMRGCIKVSPSLMDLADLPPVPSAQNVVNLFGG